MRIQSAVNQVDHSGFTEDETSFSIKASPMAFKILSDKLYSDKPLAVLREIGCNAYDAHIAAGTQDRPFIVNLPNTLHPFLTIRDFGTGLSHAQVMKLYTTFFESTKSDSNDFVGALGLGSKSPFSYCDQFSVESYFNGMKTTYSAFIGKNGTPSIAKVMEEATDEDNGLAVSIMAKAEDFRTFADRARRVFFRFPVQPVITGNTDTGLNKVEYKLEGPNYRVRHHDYDNSGCYAVQGVVAYPIAARRIDIPMTQQARNILNNAQIDIDFAIGDLDIAPSREELSYDKRTQQNIVDAVEKIALHIPVFVKDVLDEAANLYEAKLLWNKWMNDSSQQFIRQLIGKKLVWKGQEIDNAVLELITFDTVAAEAADVQPHAHHWSVTDLVPVFKKQNFTPWGDIVQFFSNQICPRSIYKKQPKGDRYFKRDLNVTRDNLVVVLQDCDRLTRNLHLLIKHNFGGKNKDVMVIRVDPANHKHILDQLHGYPVVMSSTLEDFPVAMAYKEETAKRDVRTLYEMSFNNYGASYSDKPYDLNQGGVYVVLYNREVVAPDNLDFAPGKTPKFVGRPMLELLAKAQHMGLFKGVAVMGVNSSVRGPVMKNAKWVDVFTYLKKRITELQSDASMKDYLELSVLHDTLKSTSEIYSNALCDFSGLARIQPTKSNSKFIEIRSFIEDLTTRYEARIKEFADKVVHLRHKVGQSVDVYQADLTHFFVSASDLLGTPKPDLDKHTKKALSLADKWNKSYPLLSHFLRFHDLAVHPTKFGYNDDNITKDAKKIAHYIDLCDASPSLTAKF